MLLVRIQNHCLIRYLNKYVRGFMFDYDCCHRRQRVVCPNMATAKRKFVLMMCCACICSCTTTTAARAELSDDAETIATVTPGTTQVAQFLFRKYGGDNGFMTIKGFELLMSNLGLIKNTNASHEQNDINTETEELLYKSDGKGSLYHTKQQENDRHLNQKDVWNHLSKSQDIETHNRCLSSSEIIRILKKSTEKNSQVTNIDEDHESDLKISPVIFGDLCTALIFEMERKSCYSNFNDFKYDHIHSQNNSTSYKERANINIETNDTVEPKLAWLYASISVLIISASGLLGIAVVPFSRSPSYPQLLRFLVALAVGTLCGDALMHLLPHALMPHSHSHNNMEIIEHSDNHNIPMYKCGVTFITVLIFYALESLLPVFNKGMDYHNHGHGHEMKPELGSMLTGAENNPKKDFSPIALMIILGDSLHNLTDGLAIGAAFSNDSVTGLATSIAVLCHELPHEFGDFAVLLRAGYSVKRVLYFNIMSSLLSFIGMAIGLLLASGHAATSQWIYAATAGSFLYIALADLVPEMSEGNQKVLGSTLMQIAGIALGGVIMLLIALNEDSLRSLFT